MSQPPGERVEALTTRYASQTHLYPFRASSPCTSTPACRPLTTPGSAGPSATPWTGAPSSSCTRDRPRSPASFCRPTSPATSPPAPTPWTPTRPGRGRADRAAAAQLIKASGTRGMRVTVWSYWEFAGVNRYLVKLLDSLGYHARLRTIGPDFEKWYDYVADSRNKAQVAAYWFNGALSPAELTSWLRCGSFVPNSGDNLNTAQFCSRTLEGKDRAGSAPAGYRPGGGGAGLGGGRPPDRGRGGGHLAAVRASSPATAVAEGLGWIANKTRRPRSLLVPVLCAFAAAGGQAELAAAEDGGSVAEARQRAAPVIAPLDRLSDSPSPLALFQRRPALFLAKGRAVPAGGRCQVGREWRLATPVAWEQLSYPFGPPTPVPAGRSTRPAGYTASRPDTPAPARCADRSAGARPCNVRSSCSPRGRRLEHQADRTLAPAPSPVASLGLTRRREVPCCWPRRTSQQIFRPGAVHHRKDRQPACLPHPHQARRCRSRRAAVPPPARRKQH